MRRIQLDFIDGLRALLALYILTNHVVQFLRAVPYGLSMFGYGQPAVAMFLTISGFCLALPQASSGEWTVDARGFFLRRARRILPPYYAAMAIAIVFNTVFQMLGLFRDGVGEFTFYTVWSHALLIQNWLGRQFYTLDGPLWSIAVECQIYLLFPIVVLLRRRWNWYGMLATAAVFSLCTFHLFGGFGLLYFLFFFVLGVLSAELAFRKRQRWLTLGAIGVASLIPLVHHLSGPQKEACASLASAGLLAYLSGEEGNIVRRLLGWRPLAWIGTFSYSIYLLHALFLTAARYATRHREPDLGDHFNLRFVLFWSAIALVSLAASFGFHVLFERPFMSNKRQKTEQRLAVV